MSRVFNRLLFLVLLSFSLSCGGGGDGGTGPDQNAVNSVVVAPGSSTLTSLGATTTLSAEARNSSNAAVSGKTFTWTSLNTNIASVVSGTGVVTAVAVGTATIRATVGGGTVSGTAQVTVQQTITAVTSTQTGATVAMGAALQMNATARDAGGAAVAAATIAWTSANTGIATVNPSTGVATGAAVGNTMITASSGGFSVAIPLTVITPPLTITKDTTISGNVNVDGLSIAAGFTVTVNGPLTLRSTRLVSIAGTLNGNCQSFDIQGDTAVVINGTINNGCAVNTPGVPLRIASNGELIIENANIQSSGAITFTNNPALAASAAGARARGSGLFGGGAQGLEGVPGVRFTRIGNSTVRYRGGAGAGPDPAPKGADGANGGAGTDGRPVLFELDGNAQFVGNTLIWGQDGGAGGIGTFEQAGDFTIFGGRGGSGGLLRVVVAGTLTYSGGNNVLRTGAGGRGGNVNATALQSTVGTKAPGATAVAGNAGNPGLVEIEANGGINVAQADAMAIEIGAAGAGGDAVAIGANGMNAVGVKVAQAGGDALARAGNGGSTPNTSLVKIGNVTGAPAIVRGANGVGTVDGGRGGNARTTAGNGGNGDNPAKNGANGGGSNTIGGNGGASDLRGINNQALGFGGIGGLAWLLGGNGGNGWNDCSTFIEPGGHGGNGGGMSGTAGRGGGGTMGAGANGTIRFENVANGGNAGRGIIATTPGQGGIKVVSGAEEAPVGETFTAGDAATPCPLQPNTPPSGQYFVAIAGWPNSNGVISTGEYANSLSLIPGGPVITGSDVRIITSSAAGQYYFGAGLPARIGDRLGQGWTINLLSVDEGGPGTADVESFSICFLNANPPISPANPLIVRQTMQGPPFKQLAEDVITAGVPPDGRPGCKTYPRFFNMMNGDETTHVNWSRPTGGIEVDMIVFTIENSPLRSTRLRR